MKKRNLLKILRMDANLSQNDVSKKLGYKTPQFISNWERGISRPPLSSLKYLADIYGVDVRVIGRELYKQEQEKLTKSFQQFI